MVDICYPTAEDAQALLAFEVENRAYFESWMTARDDSYYDLIAMRAAIAATRRPRDINFSLSKEHGTIVGRVNLRGVTRPYFNKASLGYRIGERFAGQGYASEAVRLVLKKAHADFALSRIEATARPENEASSRVLTRNVLDHAAWLGVA